MDNNCALIAELPHEAAWRNARRITLLLCAIGGTFLNAGLVFGFSALYPALVSHGVFHDNCPGELDVCHSQALALSTMFTVATSGLNIASVPTGVILDRLGPRFTAMVASSIVSLGCVLFAYGGDGPWQVMYYGGFAAMALVGPAVFISTISFANLFHGSEGLVTAALVGSFDASSGVFFVLARLIGNLGISFVDVFTGFAVLPLLTMLAAFFLWPRQSIGKRAQTGSVQDLPPLATLTFHQQLLCVEYWLCVVMVSVTMLCINFYIATVNQQMEQVSSVHGLALSKVFAVVLPLGGIIFIPIVGAVADRLEADMSWFVLWASMAVFALLKFAYETSSHEILAYMSFVIFAFCRPLLYTMAAGYMGQTFGFSNFGKLYGLQFTVAGVVNLAVRPLHELAQSHGFQTTTLTLVTLQLSTVVFPGLLRMRKKRQRRNLCNAA